MKRKIALLLATALISVACSVANASMYCTVIFGTKYCWSKP